MEWTIFPSTLPTFSAASSVERHIAGAHPKQNTETFERYSGIAGNYLGTATCSPLIADITLFCFAAKPLNNKCGHTKTITFIISGLQTRLSKGCQIAT
jgi:hypothetical protein